MKKLCFILIFLLTLSPPVAATEGYDLAYPFDESGIGRIVIENRWGLVNQDFNMILSPSWDYVGENVEGFRSIRQGNLFGFADEMGKLAIKPVYAQAEGFSQGLACVKNEEGKWGYINTKGTLTIPFAYDNAHSFAEGLALVKIGELYGYIDQGGVLVIPPIYEEAYSFSEGLACVRVGELYGYIDTKGQIAITPQFELAFDFHDGVAVIKNNGYGVIDATGSLLIAPNWDQLSTQVNNGLLKATRGNRMAFMNTKGILKTEFIYSQLGDFKEGLCPVETESGWGYINEEFDMVIPAVWDGANQFSNGYAAVLRNHLWGYIDTSGTPVTAIQYADCSYAVDDWVSVCNTDGIYQYISLKDALPPSIGTDRQNNTLLLTIGHTTMQHGDMQVTLDVAPKIYNGHTLLPIRSITEEIDGVVEWAGDEQKITLKRNGHVVILHIGETAAFIDGRITLLPTPPIIENERTLLPLRFCAESLDCIVDWNPDTEEIQITY